MKGLLKYLWMNFLVIWLIVYAHQAKADYINDLHTGHKLMYEMHDTDMAGDATNFYLGMHIAYPILENLENTLMQSVVNQRIRYLVTGQIKTDSFRRELVQHLRSATRVYMFTSKEHKDELDLLSDEALNFHPIVNGVSMQMFTYYKNLLIVQISFSYKATFEIKELKPDFIYKQVVYFDLHSGKEYSPLQVFRKESLPEVNKMVQERASEHLEEIRRAYGDSLSSVYYRNDVAVSYKARLYRFSIKNEGFLYLKAFSFAFHISDFSPGTYQFNGMGLEIRFEPSELIPFLNPNGPFAVMMKDYFGKIKTTVKENNPETYIYQPLFTSLYCTPKKLLAGNQVKVYRANNINQEAVLEYKFDGNGYCTAITTNSRSLLSDKVLNTEMQYNKEGKLLNRKVTNDNKVTFNEKYYYDTAGYLNSIKFFSYEQGTYKSIYFRKMEKCWMAEIYNDADVYPSVYRFDMGEAMKKNLKGDSVTTTAFRSTDAFDKMRWPVSASIYIVDTIPVALEYFNGKRYASISYRRETKTISEIFRQNDRVIEERLFEVDEEGKPLKCTISKESGETEQYIYK